MIAERARVLLGVEVLPDEDSPADPQRHPLPGPPIVLWGHTVRDAFDGFVAAAPALVWNETADGVINVLPRALGSRTDAFLNRRVPVFDLRGSGVVEALVAVHRVLDPSYSTGGQGVIESLSGPSAERIAQTRKQREVDHARPLTVHLENATVLEILNAIVLAHGLMTWELTYRRAPAVYQSATLRFRGFNGWATALVH